MRRGREIAGNGGAEFRQIEERDGREHVMFDVVMHIPVEEGRQPRASKRAATEPKVRRIRRETEMLRGFAEEIQPAAVMPPVD